jgi:hypothetical protein
MAIVLTIDGVQKYYRVGSLRISATNNGRKTASFDVRSNDGSYRPDRDEEVIITENGTRIFGGLVDKVTESSTIGDKWGSYAAISTRVSAVDFNHYPERRYVNETLASGSLKSVLTTLVATYLSDYGVTLHGSQATGPAIPETICLWRPLTEVLNELSVVTGKYGEPYVWKVDDFKVLRMAQPSSAAAPFNITAGDKLVIGDVTVEQTRDQYANRIIIKVPGKSELEHVETFTGDGSTTSFTPSTGWSVLKTYGYIAVDGTNFETMGPTGDPDNPTWEIDSSGTITRIDGAPNDGSIVTFRFDGEYSGEAVAEDSGEISANGLWERVVLVEEVPPGETAQTLAEGYLAQALDTPKVIRYKTFEAGLAPQQTQTVTLAGRNLSAVSAVVTDVNITDHGPHGRLIRSVTLTSGTNPKDGWREIYKLWSGDKAGGAALTPATTTGTGFPVSGSGAAPPLRSNQFNRNNVLGGHADWLFYEEYTTATLGTSHVAAGTANMLIGRGHRVMDSGSFSAALETSMYPFDASLYDVGGLYDEGGGAGPIA